MSDKYDIVLYGATGFTGQLAVSYMARQYKNDLKWAIAGRNKDKLLALKKSNGADYCDIIVADSTDKKSLDAMCAQTKVVATTAGPFSRYGSAVVQACVDAGCDYCDITGESQWVRDMIATHDNNARKSGSRIVHFCGHDCVPWDLMTLMLANKLKENNGEEQLVNVDMYDKIKSSPSGGTLETAFGLMFGTDGKKKSSAIKELGFDPLLKQVEAEGASTSSTSARNVSSVEAGKGGQPARAMFFMSGVNANCVKRSNALNHYGDKIIYKEGVAFSSMFKAVMFYLQLVLFGLSLYIPPLRWALRKWVLPKPGEGPSMEEMDKGFLKLTGVGKGSKGSSATATLSFKVDPGYKDTARMLVESALCLSLQDKELKQRKGGVYTPAACQGEVLLKRLCDTGSAFRGR